MDKETEDLASSFRQSRKELRFMILTWVAFAAWTGGFNHFFASAESGQEVAVWLGMPKWVIGGIVIPWLAAVSLTVWFAMFYMKDTDLGSDSDSREQGGES